MSGIPYSGISGSENKMLKFRFSRHNVFTDKAGSRTAGQESRFERNPEERDKFSMTTLLKFARSHALRGNESVTVPTDPARKTSGTQKAWTVATRCAFLASISPVRYIASHTSLRKHVLMHTVELEGSKEPITVGKILCIGRNYAAHAKEMKSDVDESPVFFLKPASALIHDGETIVIPSVSNDVHHEVELTVLIGKDGKNIPKANALSHVAGYGVGLDMTLRDVQAEAKKNGLPWTLAKGFDTSAVISSFVAANKVTNPQAVEVELKVNGTVRQTGKTELQIFSVQHFIWYVSQFITLERGDIIYTGTPEGVAQIKPGDRLEAVLRSSSGQPLTMLRARVQ